MATLEVKVRIPCDLRSCPDQHLEMSRAKVGEDLWKNRIEKVVRPLPIAAADQI